MKYSIITPVWNKSGLTRAFLENHLLFHHDLDVEHIIVDNGSTDDTPQVLAEFVDRFGGPTKLMIVRNETNVGFGPGHNQGAFYATGNILVHISNDVKGLISYLPLVTMALERYQNRALVGPEVITYPTGWNTFEEIGVLSYLAGWCVATTREIWEELGGFDEQFVPCDYEDLDLSYRAQQADIALVQTMLAMSHAFGQSAQDLPGGRLEITLQNQKRFLDKWGLTLKGE
jgi:GT2 family glycosyltransferase